MKIADLHVHSNNSDGSDSVENLVNELQKNKVEIFALTDHDTIAGCVEITKYIPQNIKFIPSIELTCQTDDIKCHILGFNCNPEDEKLNSLIQKGKELRRKKLETRLDYMKNVLKIDLTQEELNWLYSRQSVVKTHLANLLVKRNMAKTNVEAMQKYLDGIKTGNTRFTIEEAIDAIVTSGGTPVWAHPLGGEGEETDVEEADVGHEQADAAADGVLQHFRNGLDDHLTNLGDGDDDVDQTAQEHHAQGFLPLEAEAEAHGVGEERVEAHAGGLRVRNVGEQAHHERADDGRDDGGEEHAAPRHTGRRQDLRVDDDDVGHGEERGQAGHDLRGDGGAVLLEMEEFLHFLFSHLSWVGRRVPYGGVRRRESRLAWDMRP